jgi:hypothetical protein
MASNEPKKKLHHNYKLNGIPENHEQKKTVLLIILQIKFNLSYSSPRFDAYKAA